MATSEYILKAGKLQKTELYTITATNGTKAPVEAKLEYYLLGPKRWVNIIIPPFTTPSGFNFTLYETGNDPSISLTFERLAEIRLEEAKNHFSVLGIETPTFTLRASSEPLQQPFEERPKATGSYAKLNNQWRIDVFLSKKDKLAFVSNAKGEKFNPPYIYPLNKKDKDVIDLTLIELNNKYKKPDTPPLKPEQIDILGLGILYTTTTADAPLLVNFGGMDCSGKTNKEYMSTYFNNDILKKYHVFISNENLSDSGGSKVYKEIEKKLQEKNFKPSSKILYSFSAGYRATHNLFTTNTSNTDSWSKIIIVDIYVSTTDTYKNFYRELVKKSNVYFIYGSGAGSEAGEKERRENLLPSMGDRAIKADPYSHCSTHKTAVKQL